MEMLYFPISYMNVLEVHFLSFLGICSNIVKLFLEQKIPLRRVLCFVKIILYQSAMDTRQLTLGSPLEKGRRGKRSGAELPTLA